MSKLQTQPNDKSSKEEPFDDLSVKINLMTQPVIDKIKEITSLSDELKVICVEIQKPLPPEKKIIDVKVEEITKKFQLVSLNVNNDIKSFTLEKDLMSEIRINMIRKYSKIFSDAVQEYNNNLAEYANLIKEKDIRLIRLHFGNQLSEKQIQNIATEGNVEHYIQHSISHDLSETIYELEARHSDILKLEREIRSVQELFVNLSILVNVQGDHLDVIEQHIKNSVDAVENGEKNIIVAEKYQSSARKRQCCIVVIILTVLFVVIGVPIIKVMNST